MFKLLLLRAQKEMNMLLETRGKRDPCSIVAESSVELCLTVMQEVECFIYDLEHSAEEFSKQS